MTLEFAQNRPRHLEPIDLWAMAPSFEGLPDTIIHALNDAATCRRYAAGELLFLEGEPTAGLFMIETGAVKVSRVSRDGREQILQLAPRGTTFNEVSVLDGGPNPATAIAHTDTVAWCITRAELRHLTDTYPELAWALIESIARRARHLVSLVEDLSMRSVRGRLARLILELADEYGDSEIPRVLTQEEMASRLGTVREVVGRALRGLAADQIIDFDRQSITVLDRERLQQETHA
jgi:CRP-like cAMP-binding protein